MSFQGGGGNIMGHPWWLRLRGRTVTMRQRRQTAKRTNRQTDRQTISWTLPMRKAPLLRRLNKVECVVWATERDGFVCSGECTSHGCWGSDDDQCLSCRNHRHGRLCVSSCSQFRGLYQVNKSSECAQCHEQCDDVVSACTGPVRISCVLLRASLYVSKRGAY